jgi:hypothetical protein
MGMAHQAPVSRYRRRYTISTHAVDRFRERVDQDTKCRPHHDLANLLDEKVQQSKSQYTVRDPRAPESATQLFAIEMRGGTYFAVVRDETVITVLDESMVKTNYEVNWKPVLNAPFADKLKGVQIAKPPEKLDQTPKQIVKTPIDQAILVGALPLPVNSPPLPNPLDTAGADYARALKRKRDAQLAVDAAKQAVTTAEQAFFDAEVECEQARLALFTLAEGAE